MSERFDFHTHTRVSDGSLTPTELVERAAANKVTGFALTDHDTVGGIAEARAAGAARGIEVIAGIEISVSENDGKRGLHVLGLGIDDESPALLARLDQLQRGREGRAARIVAHLQRAGIDITLAQVEVESGGGTIGRPHVARALVAVGACADVEDAFAKFLRRGKAAFEPNTALSAGEAIALVHAAGGVAVLAHPPLSAGVDGPGGLAAFVERLLSARPRRPRALAPESQGHDRAQARPDRARARPARDRRQRLPRRRSPRRRDRPRSFQQAARRPQRPRRARVAHLPAARGAGFDRHRGRE